MDNSRDELDRLIEGALAGYSDAEPLAGLEERVVNRVRAARARRRVVAWAAAVAVAASVVVVGVVVRTERRVPPKPAEVAGVTNVAPPAAVATPEPRIRRAARSRRPKALPKLEQFPAPEPLTAEEKALLALVEHDPKEAQQVFTALSQSGDGPIQIAPIEIAPLQSGGAQ